MRVGRLSQVAVMLSSMALYRACSGRIPGDVVAAQLAGYNRRTRILSFIIYVICRVSACPRSYGRVLFGRLG